MHIESYAWLEHNYWSGRIRLRPHAWSALPEWFEQRDHDWLVTPNSAGTVRLQNVSTGHHFDLTPAEVDRVVNDMSAPRDGLAHGLLTLARRLVLNGAAIEWVPIRRRRLLRHR